MDWSKLIQTLVTGLADGGIYAVLALALVLIHRATGVINFAQGEMAMFSTYIAFWLISDPEGWQLSFWIGFGITLAVSFLGGAAVYGGIIRPLARAGPIAIVIATIALLIVLNGTAAWIWSAEPQYIASPFPFEPITVGDVAIAKQTIYVFGVSIVCVLVVYLIFRFTRTGLQMRAAAVRPETSRLLGIRVAAMLAIGWGLAAALGAVAGLMAVVSAPPLDPNYMLTILVYAFAAAVLGGLDSPAGAVAGAYILGVGVAMLQTYVGFVGRYQEFKLPIALGVLLLVLLVKPAGLFGRTVARRV
ncbi:MAG TPA: branched-chain amino acid ABC transporter permease [Gaiellaceae bacterium]|nr:branched-chain amino acid ABC transporter permease [Gaiellaceae bacterium]